MTAEEHNRTLAMLHFIYSGIHGLTLAALALLILIARLASPIPISISRFWFALAATAFFTVLVAIVLLPLAAGYGLRKHTRWAKAVTITSGIVSLINIPIGTALGIYALKFFRSGAGATLYGGSGATGEAELQDALQKTARLRNLADRVS